MAFNPDRFVVIDGVQVSKARALRLGLVDEKGTIVRSDDRAPTAEPGSNRARSSASARTGRGGKTKDVAPAPEADGDADHQE